MTPKTLKNKKLYTPPRLVKYGDLARLTGGTGGSSKDGNIKPSSKSAGPG